MVLKLIVIFPCALPLAGPDEKEKVIAMVSAFQRLPELSIFTSLINNLSGLLLHGTGTLRFLYLCSEW